MIDWTKWKLVPVEPNAAMVEAGISAIKQAPDVGGICAEYTAEAYDAYTAMLAAAPPAPVVEVTKATCAKVARANVDARLAAAPDEILESATAIEALAWLFKWQQVLVHTIGMVTREELARAVEAAFKEGIMKQREAYIMGKTHHEVWLNSNARKALGGVE